MKKTFICIAAAAIILGMNNKAITSSGQPPVGHTGAPGQQTCATSGCHTGNLNTGTGSIAILNAPASYVPGTTYSMQIQVNLAGRTRAGFQLVAVNASNAQAGTFAVVSTANTSLQTSGGKQYLAHNNASSNNIWTFNWTAPATNVGAVTFYYAGNAANGDGNTGGDFIYTGSRVLNPNTSTGISEDQATAVKFFPNPASGKLNLELAEPAGNLKVLDFAGREILNKNKVRSNTQLDVSNYPNGTYFLQVEQNKTLQLKRFVVQH